MQLWWKFSGTFYLKQQKNLHKTSKVFQMEKRLLYSYYVYLFFLFTDFFYVHFFSFTYSESGGFSIQTFSPHFDLWSTSLKRPQVQCFASSTECDERGSEGWVNTDKSFAPVCPHSFFVGCSQSEMPRLNCFGIKLKKRKKRQKKIFKKI